MTTTSGRPRPRRPRDPASTREALLDAALEEFAAHGYAGARTQEIAARAATNKQMISYHFGGKEGLWRALTERWLATEAAFDGASLPLPELLARYAGAALDDPRQTRLLLWAALAPGGADASPGDEAERARTDVADIASRRGRGELAGELDPSFVLLALYGAALAPIALPQVAADATGLDPASPEFRERWLEQLRLIVSRLA